MLKSSLSYGVEAAGTTSRRDSISTQLCAGATTLFGREAIPTVAAFRILRAAAARTFARFLVAFIILVVRASLLARRFAVLHLEARRVTTVAVLATAIAFVGTGLLVAVVFVVIWAFLLTSTVLSALREALTP